MTIEVAKIDDVDIEIGTLIQQDPSPEWTARWIEHFLTVPNEIAQVVPMKLFPQQRMMLNNATGRDVTVKGRQTRASSLIMARNVRLMTTGQLWNGTCVVGAQDDQTTETFRQRIAHHIVNDLANKGMKLKLAANNPNELRIEGFDNRFLFVSGEQRTMVRGFSGQILHLSEFAHWKEVAFEHLGSALPAVPSAPYGWVDLESTPKGETGAFYKYAMNARPFNPKDEFTVHFYPWWLEPRYTVSDDMRSNADIKLSTNDLWHEEYDFIPDDTEQRLMQEHGLGIRRILWRRRKKLAQDKTNAPFLQEFVEDLDTCWVGVQGKFFDTPDGVDHVQFYRDSRHDPVKVLDSLPYRGDAVPLYNGLSVWEFPDHLDTYVCGFDAAGGGLSEDSDWSVMYVISVKKEKIVAKLRLKVAPDIFAAQIAAIATWYKNATVNGERSHHGAVVFQKLRQLQYPNIYYHVDPFKPPKKGQVIDPGMYPTEDIRREILEKFKNAITNNALMSADKDLVREMSGFTWQKVQQRLKAAALEIIEMHDDTIFAAAYTWYIVDKIRMRLKVQERRNEEDIVSIGALGRLVRRQDYDGHPISDAWRGV